MNIAVIKLKDIIKYTLATAFLLIMIWGSTSIFKREEFASELEKVENETFSSMRNSSLLVCIKTELPLIKVYDQKEETEKIGMTEKILSTQLSLINNIDEIKAQEESKLEEININEDKENEKESINEFNNKDVLESAHTQIISEHNINAKYTDTADTVQINNQTAFNIDEIIKNSNYELTNKNKIVIYHTHTTESYTSSDTFNYEMTGVYRTTDLNFTVARVGDELQNLLTSYGKNVIHDKTYHDYPAYNGSYGRSLKTMEGILANNKDAEIMIDLHRDAVGSSNTYGPTVKIGDEICAQVMFVIGSNGSGLYHPNWQENLKFAIKVQKKANEMYPRAF